MNAVSNETFSLRADHPALAEITAASAVLAPDRPVVALTAAAADAYKFAADCGLEFVVRTGDRARLTFALASLIRSGGGRWVISTATGSYDGFSGRAVSWSDGRYRDTASSDASWAGGSPSLSRQLLIAVTVQHQATARTVLGGAVTVLCESMTSAPPTGWGFTEPATQLWNPAALTTAVRRRMPAPTRLIATGPGFIAGVCVTRTGRGLEEDIVAVSIVAEAAETATDAAVHALSRVATESTLASALAYQRLGPSDLLVAAGPDLPTAPVALVLGPRAVRDLGIDTLESSPLPQPTRIGRPRAPALLWRIGSAQESGWEQLARFTTYLGPAVVGEQNPELVARFARQ